MMTVMLDSMNSLVLLADAPSTLTLGTIGAGCLLAYEVLRHPRPAKKAARLEWQCVPGPFDFSVAEPSGLFLTRAAEIDPDPMVIGADNWRNSSAA
ncbi:MAG TPA: hypothetical protein VFE24_00880 [Pirellulales bacterium]|jgi:hypothetical protein|nr:hypothetical protein [Pirellulales bacterium]